MFKMNLLSKRCLLSIVTISAIALTSSTNASKRADREDEISPIPFDQADTGVTLDTNGLHEIFRGTVFGDSNMPFYNRALADCQPMEVVDQFHQSEEASATARNLDLVDQMLRFNTEEGTTAALKLLTELVQTESNAEAALKLGHLYLEGKIACATNAETSKKARRGSRGTLAKKAESAADAKERQKAFNNEQALKYFMRGHELGNPDATYEAGKLMVEKFSHAPDRRMSAYKLIASAAYDGHPKSNLLLGQLLIKSALENPLLPGTGVAIEKAHQYYSRCLERSSHHREEGVQALIEIGHLHRYGMGVAKDDTIAFDFYLRALESQKPGVVEQIDMRYMKDVSSLVSDIDQGKFVRYYFGATPEWELLDATREITSVKIPTAVVAGENGQRK